MPLLRLASLIVAALLVAALSAFAPPPSAQSQSLSIQSHEIAPAAPSVLAAQLPDAGWSRLQAARAPTLRAQGLAHAAGQSVPGAGQ